MRKTGIFLLFLLLILSPFQSASAEGYGDLFISVGDAIMKVKAEDWTAADGLITQLNNDWEAVDQTDSKEAKNVESSIAALNEALEKKDKEQVLDALTDVSHSLVAFEKEQNPVDQEKQREEFQAALSPVLADLKQAIEAKDADETFTQYEAFLAAWTRNESVVREQSIAYYGKIETQMGFLRIALTKEEKDFNKIGEIYGSLEEAVNGFASGKQVKAENNSYSLDTLVGLLEKADNALSQKDTDTAVSSLEEFLTVWPSVEGEVRTRNGSLYTKLESDIPVLAGKLSSGNADLAENQQKIQEYKQSVELLQAKTDYTIWDAALILLREGLEALLIVTALIAFLRKAGAPQHQKWIWVGAAAGVLMSIAAAVFITTAFSSLSAGANREAIEGFTGVVAVAMMTAVGIWLHQKSSIKLWNQYIQKQIGVAVSTGSIITMALVSFLSIFREGAETIIFYVGMAPAISTGKLLTGIAAAAAILAVFAFVFLRYSKKIPVAPFFKVATFLIYFLAFKILGVSLHALQLTGYLETTQIQSLPIISWLGFYPTWETLIPQLILIAIFVLTSVRVEIKGRAKEQIV
ncbi:FTR1 family protein [Bacillus salacetis]|uniref:FTR1 family protein n=1 Tax=Bacillus salacetis TaxID=2315464 RepID=UPI003BA0B68A